MNLFRKQNNAVEFFIDRNLAKGNDKKIAIYQANKDALSYQDLAERINKSGNLLLGCGVKRNQKIALLFPDSQDLVSCFFAVLKIGAVAVPLNTFSDPSALTFYLADSGSVMLLADKSFQNLVDQLKTKELPCLENVLFFDDNQVKNQSNQLDGTPVHEDNDAFWLYTSGSTGPPKAAMHRHKGMAICAQNHGHHVLEITAKDICFSTSKIFFAYGLGNSILFPFSVGAASILNPERPTFEVVAENIRRFNPTLFFTVPTAYNKLLESPEIDADLFQTVRMCISAGEYLPTTIFDKWLERTNIKIIDGIGTTEAMHIFCSNTKTSVKAGTSGKPVPGYELRIVDEENKPVKQGQTGRLLLKGKTLAKGYWNRYDETQKVFNGEWLRTGDLYYVDEDGYYVYAGREGDAFKCGGLWVSPSEIEQVILSHEDVIEPLSLRPPIRLA